VARGTPALAQDLFEFQPGAVHDRSPRNGIEAETQCCWLGMTEHPDR
jgi:hypothetical protein